MARLRIVELFLLAGPARKVSVTLPDNGKPTVAGHFVPRFRFVLGIGSTFSKLGDSS